MTINFITPTNPLPHIIIQSRRTYVQIQVPFQSNNSFHFFFLHIYLFVYPYI